MRAKRILPQAISSDKELIRNYRHSLAEKSNREIPWLTIAFAMVNAFYFITDRYIRHMPQISYVRILPTLLGLFIYYLYLKKKSTPESLSNLREIWFLSGLGMLYAISYMTYTTAVYKSSIPALLIIIFGAAVTVPLPTRRLAFIYFIPFVIFIVAIVVSQPDMHPLIEMATVVSWSIVCLIMNEVRDRLSFSEFTLKRQLEATIYELKTTQTQLIQKEKMASLGELMAGIAHEIQNPLNFVNNFSEVSTELVGELREEEAKSESDPELIGELVDGLAQNLEKITHHGNRASSIVKGMLDHSRTSAGERYPTDLNALANEYLHLSYQGWAAKDKSFNCELVTDFDPDLGKTDLIPQDMGRVLLNLLNNAFYAVQEHQKKSPLTNSSDDPERGTYRPTVTISTRQQAPLLGGGAWIEIRVKDNGTGIPESVKAKIFQPFFTTKPTGEGTGLGLSLSYDIVTKGHGGTLTVNSVQSQFTEFLISLPA